LTIAITLDTTSDGTVTLQINALGTKSLMKINSSGTDTNLVGSELSVGRIYLFQYDGTRFVWQNAVSADQMYIAGTAGNVVTVSSTNNLLGSTTQSVLISGTTYAATPKTAIVDNDEFPITDSEATYVLKKFTWTSLKAAIKTYTDTLYSKVADLTGTNETLGGTAAVGSATTAARSDHKHAITNPALDTLASPTDVTTLDASTSQHGLLIKATAPASGLLSVVGIGNGETVYANKAIFDTTNPANVGTVSPGTQVIAARRDHVHHAPGLVTPITNANDIFSLATVSGSGWSGTINGAPSGEVVTYTNVSGNKNTLVPTSTNQLGKQRLYNTTRGTNYLISTSNGSSTITMTASPTGWQSGDTITTLSPTVAQAGWVDIELTSGELLNKPGGFLLLLMSDSGGAAGSYLIVHPFVAYSSSKQVYVLTQTASYISSIVPLPITSNVFSCFWTASGTGTASFSIRQAAWIS
jgi:hypothetical protein